MLPRGSALPVAGGVLGQLLSSAGDGVRPRGLQVPGNTLKGGSPAAGWPPPRNRGRHHGRTRPHSVRSPPPGHRRRSGRAPQPSASSPVNGTGLQYAGWVLRVAATRKSGSARVVVACRIVVVDQRSGAAALQSESVLPNRISTIRAVGGCRVFGQLQGESQTWRWSWCETKDGCPALLADSGCSNGDRRILAGHFFNTRTGWAVEGFAEEG